MRRFVRQLQNLLAIRKGDSTLSRRAAGVINRIRSSDLTYCGPPKLENLVDALMLVEREQIPGALIEAGVALGGSAILLATLKSAHRPLHLYDVFRMIPAPNANDGPDAHARYEVIRSGKSLGLGGNVYYGYVDNLLEVVKGNLRRFDLLEGRDKIYFHIGLFQDTLHPDGPVALAHIDADWYDSVRTCIDRISSVLSPGGIIVFDDYSSYQGCRRAVDEFLASRNDFSILFHRRSLAIRRDSI